VGFLPKVQDAQYSQVLALYEGTPPNHPELVGQASPQSFVSLALTHCAAEERI